MNRTTAALTRRDLLRLISLTPMGISLSGEAAAQLLHAASRTQVPRQREPTAGQWESWLAPSVRALRPPAPPARSSARTLLELRELLDLQARRTDGTRALVQFWDLQGGIPRWSHILLDKIQANKVNPVRAARALALVHTAIADATLCAWDAKFVYNRRPPSEVNSRILSLSQEDDRLPAYVSEHAAVAAAAVSVLMPFFPKEEANLKAMAAEISQTRLLMGANYRSDVFAGSVLGQQVAQKALAWAAADGSDAVWSGTVPTGPGLWTGTNPLEPLQGTWKPYLMTRGDQFRPGPPPAFGSAEFQEELALVKRLSSNPTPSQRAIATNFAALGLDFIWNPIYDLARRERLTVPREVRLLSLVATVQFDAYIASHDAKYIYWRLRPSMADPTIQPIIPMPNHPAYVSNAAILASAAGEVVASLYPQYAARFRYLGEEAGLSRIFGGIHYPSDERAGNEIGKKLGALALQRDQLNGN
jgi:membrane-associated phospholipid phosphatase